MRKVVSLPLHNGKCPSWLYPRMRKLTKAIVKYVIEEYGEEELINRIANPMWFQSLSNVIGFDWHSSGTTTTTTAALKDALKEEENIVAAGGKGKTSLKTPEEIVKGGEKLEVEVDKLVEASRIIAKVDNSMIQDGYSLYHHTFFFTRKSFAVVQQGMNKSNRRARRYHWNNEMRYFDMEQILVGIREKNVLVISGKDKEKLRKEMLDIVKDDYYFPKRHGIKMSDLSKRDIVFFQKVKEISPSNFKEFLLLKGLGAKRLRALALIASLIYGEELEWKDPVKYSFAHGGKDGIPFPVDKKMYDENIAFLEESIENSKLRKEEKGKALKKLYKILWKNSGSVSWK